MVSQMTRRMGVSCISIVRRGDKEESQWNTMVDFLKTTPKADMVLAEEDLADFKARHREIVERFSAAPILALNAVGGDSASNMFRAWSFCSGI